MVVEICDDFLYFEYEDFDVFVVYMGIVFIVYKV